MTKQLEIGQEAEGATEAPTSPTRWEFTIVATPVPKGRHRTTSTGRQYTPKRTREFEQLVADIGRIRCPRRWPLDRRYRLTLRVFTARDAGDGSNFQKAIEDGLNGIAWHDDKQIDQWGGEKSVDRDNPRVEITIEVLP